MPDPKMMSHVLSNFDSMLRTHIDTYIHTYVMVSKFNTSCPILEPIGTILFVVLGEN